MRLLLTRAAEDALRTQAALAARGHAVIVSPLIEIVATGACWPAGEVDAIVATSAKAFAMAPAIPADQGKVAPLFLVGQRTEAAARRRGLDGPATVAPDVAALLKTLAVTLDPKQRVLYLAGRDRKSDLEGAFTARGQPVSVVETYEARETSALTADALSALRDERIDAVLHFSRRGAALFLAAAAGAGISPLDLTHLCLSEDVAMPLHEAQCRRLGTAKAPNEAALFSLLD